MTQIGIIGFGSQANAFSQNLRDSGYGIHILLRKSSQSKKLAEKRNFSILDYDLSTIRTDIHYLIVLTPDDSHGEILSTILKINPDRKFCFIFAHGYSFIKENLKELFPGQNFGLLAPKTIASELRNRYLSKEKIVGVLDFKHCEDDQVILRKIAKDMGINHIIESSFKDEMRADLFSEQTLLCSLLPYGALKSYEFLIDKGIDPELAFVECWMEVKLIADAMLEHGPLGYLNLISPNAFIGGEKAQSTIFDQDYKKKLDSMWKDIENGSFFSEIDAMNVSKKREEVIEKWSQGPLQDSYLKFKGQSRDES
jgi:ketol-acid reductoisomerase